VTSKLTALVRRVQGATTAPGKRSELARFLKVPLSRVSEWLSGVRNPSGETTLQLLEWVTAEEAQKHKSPGSATNTARAATRRKQSCYEKPKSSRRKK
jgi:transcriptional regulator with XRE-family HTH domain